MKQRRIATFLLSILLAFQVTGGTAVVYADNNPSPSPSPTVSPSPSVSPSPDPSPSPSPVPSLAASPDPSPSPSPSPAPSASPSPSPSLSVTPAVTTPKASVTGPSTPTGAPTCGGVVPEWVYNTVLSPAQWVPADKSSFVCDRSSGYYLSPKYYYDKQNGWYEILPPSATPPDYMITSPSVIHTVIGDLTVGSPDYQLAQDLGLLGQGGIVTPGSTSTSTTGVTGAGSTNSTSNNGGSQDYIDLTNLVNVINSIQSSAQSGNVNADDNTQVGNAVTGAATVIANLINLLSSAWSWSSGQLTMFVDNILGNQTGDINLNPVQATTSGGGQLGSSASVAGPTGSDSTNSATANGDTSLTVNAQTTAGITNNVDLAAASGNVDANGNTAVGNISTGDATAEVNIINLINSLISSGSSFFGILNIFGNLNGDILFPSGFLNGALPSGTDGAATAAVSNTSADSTNTATADNSTSTDVANKVSNVVANNVTTTATSGSAEAGANTTLGNIATGAVNTTQSLFNLANTSIMGDNAVLVVVNVLGHWIGKIMSLPAGSGDSTQSALLTDNAQTSANVGNTGVGSANTATANDGTDVLANQSVAGTITNNVNVNAQSGNASVNQNTEVGDVSTGAAKAVSSVANIVNTVLNVKHWFGVLIINVFGDWTGDVNNDTAAGNAPGKGSVTSTAQPATTTGPVTLAVAFRQTAPQSVSSDTFGSGGDSSVSATAAQPLVLGDSIVQPIAVPTADLAKVSQSNLVLEIAAGLLLLAGMLFALERRVRKN